MSTKPHERIAELKRRADFGPAILQHGFRPFFLGAAVWAVLSVLLWVGTLAGFPLLPEGLDAFSWHRHEALYGFVFAAVGGFALTAVPNWTGKLPVSGWRLGILAALWLAGRIAFLIAYAIPAWVVAVADLAFPVVLVGAMARELTSANNARNHPVLGLIALIGLGDVLYHLERLGLTDTADIGLRLSIYSVATLVALIGGRVVPSFTRNWLAKRGASAMPAPSGMFDTVAVAAMVAVLFFETAAPDLYLSAILALATGLIQIVRLLRWRGYATLADPLVWILHLGYAWLGVGLILVGFAGLTYAYPQSTAIHAITTGTFGTMILAVATRASLGHTGRPLKAGVGTTLIYILVTIAALARVAAPVFGKYEMAVLWVSAIAWVGAFGLFFVLYFPVLTRHRIDR